MKINVTVDTSGFEKAMNDLREAIDEDTAEEVGEVIVKGMKKLIASGTSPIKGVGRFPRYKDPLKYPGDQKPKTPVNLKLTGDMLNALSIDTKQTKTQVATEIFYDGEEAKKEQGHREGVNGQPKRPTLPSEDGERFAVSIEKEYLKVYQAAIDKVTD